MILFPNSKLYQDIVELYQQINKITAKAKYNPILEKLENTAIDLSTAIALALSKKNKEAIQIELENCKSLCLSLYHFLLLSEKNQLIKANIVKKFLIEIKKILHIINHFDFFQKKILILSSIYGHGHMSAAKAIKEGIEAKYGCDYQVEIIDFVEIIGSLLNKTFLNLYEGSTKFMPSLYKFFFESTDKKWQIRFLNIINYPLTTKKIEKMFVEKNPALIISTFPIWDYLAYLVWKKNKNKSVKFISVVTDSISIHNAWVSGNPDYHIVANRDTAISLKKLGAEDQKIKVLGFPTQLKFLQPTNREEFLERYNLNPKKFTILLLPTIDNAKKTIQCIQDIIGKIKDINLIVITGRNLELKPKLDKTIQKENVRIIGWTELMGEFIKSCDLIITKAGGATVMECIAAEKPMIINKIIPGQEMGNAELIKQHSLGIVLPKTDISVTEAIKLIKKNYNFYKKNLNKISNPHASLDIAEFINNLLK